MTTTQLLDQTRDQPGFSSLSASEQYGQQKEIILKGLTGIGQFNALPRQEQLSVFKGALKDGVQYTYENAELGNAVHTLKGQIINGDAQAMQAASSYVQGSYTVEKLPMATRIAMRLTNAINDGTNTIFGMPDSYAGSSLNVAKTKGSDDNKARTELMDLFQGLYPEEFAKQQQEMKVANGVGIGAHIAVGIAAGVANARTAARLVASSAKTAASATAGGALRKGAQAVVQNAPLIATEAALEGAYGIFESLSTASQNGSKFGAAQAIGSFALYAGGDLAFNAIAHTIGPLLKYSLSPYSRKVKNAMGTKAKYNDQEIFNMIEQLRKGETPLEFAQLSDQPGLADHLQTNKKFWEIDNSINNGQALEELSEIDRALYDSVEIGYDVIPLENGKIRVRPTSDVESSVEFSTLYEAKEFIGKNTRFSDLQAMDLDDLNAFIARRSHILNYGLLTESLDNHARQFGGRPSSASKTFVDAGSRQPITPGEADALQGSFTPGNIFRFTEDVVEDSAQKAFTGVDEVVFSSSTVDESGNVLVHAHSQATANDYGKALAYAEEIKVREGIDLPVEKIARDQLVSSGFDSAVDEQGNLHYLFPDRIKVVTDYVDPLTGRVGESAYAKAVRKKAKTAHPLELSVGGQVTAKARKLGNSPQVYSRLATKVLSGEINSESLEGLARSYAGRMGGTGLKTPMEVRLTNIDSVKLHMAGKKLIIEAPANITNPQQARKVFNDLTYGLEKQFPVHGAKPRNTYTSAFRKSQENFMLPMANPSVREAWIQGLAKMNNAPLTKSGSWFTTTLKDGSTFKSRNIDEVARSLVLDYTDPDLLKYDMLSQGYKLEKVGNDAYKLSTVNGVDLAEGTFRQVSDAVGYQPTKLPASLSPKLVVENKIPGLSMEIQEQEIVGSKDQVDEFMSMFEDYNKTLQSAGADTKKTGEVMIKHSHINYEVRIPQISYVESFDSAVEAKKFFNGEWKSLDNLSRAAMKKGARLNFYEGKWHLVSPDKTFISRSSDELYESLKSVSTPVYTKNIIPEALDSYVNAIGKRIDFIPGDFSTALDAVDAMPSFKIGSSAQHVKGALEDFRPAVKVIRNQLLASGDKTGAKLFENVLNGVDSWVADARPSDAILNKIFRDTKGKLISSERRQGLTAMLEAANDDMRKAAFETPEFKLEKEDWGRFEQMRKWWDTIGKKAQFDQKLFLQNYVPQVRKKVNGSGAIDKTEGMSKDYLKGTFKSAQTSSKELKMIYGLERTADMARVIRNTDAMDLALTYNKIIHRDLYVNEPWKKLYGHLNESIQKKQANPAMVEQLNLFRERLTSPQLSANQKALDAQMKQFLSKVGLPSDSTQSVVDWFAKAHYRTAMAFRPWLPFRNLWQTHTILPIKTGSIREVNKAMRTFVKDPELIIDEMLRRGITSESDSLADQLREFHQAKSGGKSNTLDKMFDWGMKPFGRSDMISRGVAWISSKNLLDKGLEAYKKSGNLDDLLKKSRLSVFHQNIQDQVVGYIKAGQIDAAQNYYGKQMIRSTMFDYRAINRPLVQKGIVGKIGMQYGTHPINAAETFREFFVNGSLSDQAKGALAATVGSGALALTFKALGINNTNFLLWNQSLFTGGPGLKLLTQAPNLLDSSYRGDQARRDFSRTFSPVKLDKKNEKLSLQWPQILPGFYQAYYWGEGTKYLEQGRLWEAYLSFMTVPIDKDRRDLIFEETNGQAGG